MSGAQIAAKIEDAGLNAYLVDIEARLGSQRPAWELIGEILLDSTLERFEAHTAPDATHWQPVSPGYAAWKEGKGYDSANILILHRILMASLHWDAGDDYVSVGTDVVYAAIHQFGGPIVRRGHVITMPDRPYLGITDRDLERIGNALANYIVSGNAHGN